MILKSIRENEQRAISLGYSVARYKLGAFVMSAALAGLAGSVKALIFQFATLTDVAWQMSGEVILMTLLGGIGTLIGPIFGANFAGRLTFMDVVDALDAMKKPTILVIQQKWPPELMNKAGLAGEMMTTSMQAVGCVGLLSNGPSRDVDAIRRMKFQMLLGGVTAGHGEMAVQSVNAPVSVGGMDVAPGELIHMDENGAVKFPAQHARAVLKNAQAMLADEADKLEKMRKAKSAAEIRAINSGGTYGAKKG
jgi:4-hydroxy-4-methyl-2-oxoglutarate aldolase